MTGLAPVIPAASGGTGDRKGLPYEIFDDFLFYTVGGGIPDAPLHITSGTANGSCRNPTPTDSKGKPANIIKGTVLTVPQIKHQTFGSLPAAFKIIYYEENSLINYRISILVY